MNYTKLEIVMTIPAHLLLSAQDIRHLRHIQLARLTGIDASSFSAWSSRRRFSERSLEQLEQRLGIPKSDILQGFDLRRQDMTTARAAQAKADALIAYLNLHQQESA